MTKLFIALGIVFIVFLGVLGIDYYFFNNALKENSIASFEDYTKISFIPNNEPDDMPEDFFVKKFSINEILFYQHNFNRYKDLNNCSILNGSGFIFERNWILEPTTFDKADMIRKAFGINK